MIDLVTIVIADSRLKKDEAESFLARKNVTYIKKGLDYADATKWLEKYLLKNYKNDTYYLVKLALGINSLTRVMKDMQGQEQVFLAPYLAITEDYANIHEKIILKFKNINISFCEISSMNILKKFEMNLKHGKTEVDLSDKFNQKSPYDPETQCQVERWVREANIYLQAKNDSQLYVDKCGNRDFADSINKVKMGKKYKNQNLFVFEYNRLPDGLHGNDEQIYRWTSLLSRSLNIEKCQLSQILEIPLDVRELENMHIDDWIKMINE